jgi:branched-chain amino acid transport system substrate-binding protein
MKLLTRLLLAAAIALALASVAGCGGDDDEEGSGDTVTAAETTGGGDAPSGEPIIIGAAVAKTGIMASLDQPAYTGTEIAVEEINEKGGLLGRPLKLIAADSKSEPEEGAKAALEVLDKDATLVIVSCDFDFGGPAAREAEKAGVISFSQCGASTKFGPLGIGPHGFTMATSAPTQGAIHAEHAIEKGWKSAYVLVDTSVDFNKQVCYGFETRFKELGGKVTGKDTFLQSDASIASQVARLKSASPQPDAVMLCTYQPGLGQALRQVRSAGIEQPVFSGDDGDGYFWHKTVPGLKNFYFTTYGSIAGDDDNPKVNEFFEQFKERSGSPAPTSHSLTGYGIVEAYARAVEEAGSTDPDEVKDALESFKDEPLLLGETSFSPELHIQLTRPMALMEVVGPGKDRLVEYRRPKKVPVPPASGY